LVKGNKFIVRKYGILKNRLTGGFLFFFKVKSKKCRGRAFYFLLLIFCP